MKPKVIGLGAGGQAKVMIEALRERGDFEMAGLLDAAPEFKGRSVLGVPVLGGDELIPDLLKQGVTQFFLGIGSVRESGSRRRLFEFALAQGLKPINVIHPRAILSPSAKIEAGICILAAAVVNADACLGENVIVNTAAVVEHDCIIGAHSHVATGSPLAGGVTVGAGSHLGIGCAVRQGICIGRNAVVGAGAVVVHDVADGAVVVGVPARPIRRKLL